MRAPRLYFVNGAADWLLAGGGSIAAFAVLWAFGPPTRTAALIAAAGAFSWACNWPHFAATLWRLYHSPENTQRFPLTAFVVPLFIVAGVIGSFAYPETIAPAWVKLFLLWSPYHFSGQTVGVTMVYAKRAGFEIGKLERLALSGLVFGTYVSSTARAEAGPGPIPYYGIKVPTFGLPEWIGHAAGWGMWACGAVFLLLALRWCLDRKRALPPIVLVPAAAQVVWFVFGYRAPAFYEFVPAFHGLQYLLVAWTMHLRESSELGIEAAPLKLSAEWAAGNFIVGALLFWGIPHLLSGLPEGGLQFSMPVVISAVQIHHFFVDGVIWKLRDAKVGARLTAGLPAAA
ncbi:MAG: hypothetical protein HY925_04975 [Elusimicrobia bacterium]|nr:hypothetical protein [Elusimicrobiota bacterium]